MLPISNSKLSIIHRLPQPNNSLNKTTTSDNEFILDLSITHEHLKFFAIYRKVITGLISICFHFLIKKEETQHKQL